MSSEVNKMNKADFKLNKIDRDNGHEDYWFDVLGDTVKELTDKYMEQGLQGVFEVVYSKDENVVGIKRTFMFNFDVVISDDETLKEILKELSKEND